MDEKIGALITGGDFQALGAMRTLAKKDIPVVLIDKELCIGKYSKFKKRFFKSPSPMEENAYLDFLIKLAEEKNMYGWVIFPNNDISVYLLSKNLKVLEKYYKITTPSWDIIQYLHNKKKFYRLASKNGIQIPKTYYPANLNDVLEMKIDYPVVIKPSITDNFYQSVKMKAILIKNKDDLIKKYSWVCSIIKPSEVLIQEFIPGGPNQLYSFCPFFKNGAVISNIMARRPRQHPMDFGHATTFAELVDIPEIREISEKFLKLIKYYGICEVEFMKDPRDGKYKLIEINPRIWGWHSLAIAAGIDLPYMMFQDMVGEEVKAKKPKKDLKWVRLTTDIPTVLSEVLKRNIKISDYITSMKGNKEFAVFSFEDPLPFFMEIVMIPYLWWKRGF
ncbi:MAG: ATP-grasp domain-containing protein [Candidatus Thorarchaeota archaeon]